MDLLCATSVFSVSPCWWFGLATKSTTEAQRTPRLHREKKVKGTYFCEYIAMIISIAC